MRSMLEWLLALGVLAAAIWLGVPLLRRWLPGLEDPVTLVESVTPGLPGGVPLGAVSVPLLILPDGATVRIGLSESALEAALPARWLAGPRLTEAGVIGERHVVPYQVDRSRFWVILDQTSPRADRSVTAIYVQ
jgi:hypothetical protein